MKKYSVFDCSIVEFDRHHSDRKGNLTVVENGKTLPFDVKRVYYLYDIPGGESRGAHAHKELSCRPSGQAWHIRKVPLLLLDSAESGKALFVEVKDVGALAGHSLASHLAIDLGGPQEHVGSHSGVTHKEQ